MRATWVPLTKSSNDSRCNRLITVIKILVKPSSFVKSIYNEKYYWCNSHSLKHLCSKKCQLSSSNSKLYICVLWDDDFSSSLWCTRRCACSGKIPHCILHSSEAWIRGSSSWYNRFLFWTASRNLCNLWSHLWCEMCWTSWKSGKMAVGSSTLNNVMRTSYYHNPG
jgi:hypothetical protein